jgi:hypothetical protein
MNEKWHRILGWILVGGFLSASAALVTGISIIARRQKSELVANPGAAKAGTERDDSPGLPTVSQ